MSDCKEYGGISRDKMEKIRARLAQENVSIPAGDDVNIEAPFGVELRAVYTEAKQTLEICIIKKPFYISESQIWKIIDSGAGKYAA